MTASWIFFFLLHSLKRLKSSDHTSCGVQLGSDRRCVCVWRGFGVCVCVPWILSPWGWGRGASFCSQTVNKTIGSSPSSHSSKNSRNAVVFLPFAEPHPPPQSPGHAVTSLPQYWSHLFTVGLRSCCSSSLSWWSIHQYVWICKSNIAFGFW